MVANHSSYLDSFVLIASLPKPVRFIAKSELSKSFLTRIPLLNLRAIFVERHEMGKSIQDTQSLLEQLKQDDILLFFPEGTMTRVPGLMPFHLGAFTVAAQTAAPVIPVVIRGTRSILCPDCWFPNHGAVSLLIGPSIDPEKLHEKADLSSWERAIALRDASRTFILRHCGEPDLAQSGQRSEQEQSF